MMNIDEAMSYIVMNLCHENDNICLDESLNIVVMTYEHLIAKTEWRDIVKLNVHYMDPLLLMQ